MTQQDLADLLGVSRPSVSATISRPSFPTLERIAALDIEPWQLLAPPSVVEELKQARAAFRRWRWWLGGRCACRL